MLFTLLIKCSSVTKESLTSTYVLKTKVGNEYIKLEADETFTFKCEIPLIESESKGNWLLKDNSLIFNSFLKYKNDYIEVEELKNLDTTTIQVVDDENNGLYNIIININNDEKIFSTDTNGYVLLEKLKQGDSIKINTIDLSSEKAFYKIKSAEENRNIKITIHKKESNKKYFEHAIFKIKKDKLILNNQVYKKV